MCNVYTNSHQCFKVHTSQIHTLEIPDMSNKIYIWHSTYPKSCADYGQSFYVNVRKYSDCWPCDIFSKEAKLLCACQVWHSTTQDDFLYLVNYNPEGKKQTVGIIQKWSGKIIKLKWQIQWHQISPKWSWVNNLSKLVTMSSSFL